ncbi:hypothetical protein KAJ27_13440 [bacterium]|nr:hypothetical protein [bacterium]
MITQHLKSSIASIPVDIEIGNSISFEVELLNDYSIELDYVVKAVNPIINVNSQSFIAGENNVKLPEVTISYINGESGLFTSMKAKLTWSVKDILISDEVFFSDKEGKFNKLINIPDTLTEESHIILKYSGNVICNAPKAIFRTSLANFPIGDFDLAVANYCYRYGDKSCFIDSIIIQQDHVTTIETGDILEISIPGFMDEGTVESFISSSNFDGVFSDGMLRLTANKNFINDQVDIIKDIKINFDNTVSGNYKIFCKPIKASQSYSLKEGPSINTEIFDAGFYSAGNKLTTMVINSNPNFNGLEPEVFMIHTPYLIRGGDTLLFKITDDNAVWPSGDDESILVSNQNYNGNSYIKPYFYLNESDSQCIGLIFTDDSVVDSIAIFNLISQLQFVSNNTESKIEMKFSNSITSLSNFLIQNVSPKFNIIYRGNSDKKFIRIMRSENLDTLNKFEITGLPKGSLNGELVLSFQSTLNSAWSERGDEWEGKNEKSGQGQKLFYNLCKDSKDSVEQNFNLSDVVFQSGNSSGYGKIMLRGPNYSLYSEETIVIGSPKFSLPGNITLIPVLDNGKTYRIKGLKIEDDPFLAKRFESLKFLRKGMSINCVYPESFQIKNLVSTWDSLLFQFDGNILELVLDADPEDSIKFDIEFTLNNLPSVSKQGLSIMIKIDNLSLGAMGGTINVINPEINIDSNKVHCCWNNQDLNLANSLRGISDITEEHTLYVNLLDTTVSYNNLSDIKLYDYFPRIRSFADKPELCELFADFRSEQEDWFESIDNSDQGLPLLKSKDSWILHLPFFMSNPKTINQNICFSTLPGILDISEYSTNISNAFSLSINNLSIDFDSISIVKNIDADEYELILSDSCLLEVGHSFSTNNNDEAVFHFHNETLDFPWLSGKLTQNLQNSTFKWYSDAINPLLSDKLFEISEGKASVMAIATNDSSINDIFRYSDGKILSDFSIKTISDSLNLKGGLYLVRVNDSSGNSLPVIRQVLLDPLAPRIENPYIKDIERRFNSDYSLEIVDTNIYLNRKDNEDNPIQLSVEDSLYFPLLDNIYINDTKGVNGSLYFKSNFTDNFFEEFPLYRPIYLKNYFSIKTFLSEAKNEDKKTDSLIVEKNINDAQKLLVLSPINWGERGTYLFTYSDICGNVVCDTLILDFIKGAGSDGAILSKVINYPNPFMVSKGTRFRYSLGEDAESGRLIVFDAAGDLVFYQDLYQIMGITAGTHEFWWNGRDLFKGKLASGVYFGIFEVKGKFGSKQQRLKIAIQNL